MSQLNRLVCAAAVVGVAAAIVPMMSARSTEPAVSNLESGRLLPSIRAPKQIQEGRGGGGGGPEVDGPWSFRADGPSRIQLSDVPEPVAAGPNAPPRGGERIESRFSDQQVDDAQAAAAVQSASAGIQNLDGSQKPAGQKAKLIQSFDAIDVSDCCANTGFSAFVPPDPDIAAGPDHVVVVVNTAFEVYDKQGNSLTGPIQLSSFFDPTRGGTNPGAGEATPGCSAYADFFGIGIQFGAVFDPDVVYDAEHDRFVIGVDGNGDSFCVAATVTGDPTGAWNRYGFETDINGAFFDFPHMGVGADAVYMGSNQFGGRLRFGFEGRVFAMNKLDMYNGDPLDVRTRELAPAGMEGRRNLKLDGTPQPAHQQTTAPHYIMGEFFDGKSHAVYAWNDPFGRDEFDLVGDVDLAAGSGVPCEGFSCFPVSWPQKGSPEILQGNDYRGQETRYHDGLLWTAQTVSCNPGQGVRNCVRWAQIDPGRVVPGDLARGGFPLVSGTDGIVQAGVFGSDWGYRSFPAIGVNQCGDMAVGYSSSQDPAASEATWYPSIYVASRDADDPPGQIGGERLLKKAQGPYRSFQDNGGRAAVRWGDYTGMATDPDGKTLWYVGEYARAGTVHPSTNWGTWVGSFQVPGCE